MFQASRPLRATLERLPSGEAGTHATLQRMRDLVLQFKVHPRLIEHARGLVRGLRQKDTAAQIRRLHAWVRDQIQYVRDVRGVETLSTPAVVLVQQQGDCDDKSLLLATLLETIGIPTRFVALGFGSHFSHVLVEARLGRHWLPLETTEPVPAGWYPRQVRRRLVIYNDK